MRFLLLILLVIAGSCESRSFESDKRQLIAKDEIKRQIPRTNSFDIVSFFEDTLVSYPGSTIKYPIRYTINFQYADSLGTLQKKKGEVIFTPDGRSVIIAHIIEPDHQQH